MVVHLLMARPSNKGKGSATALMKSMELARERSCKALRLDTGSRNRPAFFLFQKLEFWIAAAASMKVGGTIEHSGHSFLEIDTLRKEKLHMSGIRAMTIDEYDALFEMWRNTPHMGLRSLDDSREGISLFLKRNPNTNFVARVGGESARV